MLYNHKIFAICFLHIIITKGKIMEEKRTQERRYRRTEKLILSGLTELLKEKKIKDITVRELADLVDINRSTFYIHYKDVYDLLEKTEQRLLDQLRTAAEKEWKDEFSPNHFFSFLEQSFTILSENAQLCAVLLGPNGDIGFLRTIEELVREKGLQTMRHLAPKSIDESDLQYAITYSLSGCIGLVGHWLKDNCRETPVHMAELCMLLLQNGLSPINASSAL